MLKCSPEIDQLADDFFAKIREIDPFAVDAAIGRLIGKCADGCEGAMDHFRAAQMTPVISSLAALHAALTSQRYVLDCDKSYGIGAGDRYVVAHAVDDVRVLGFENQNYAYMVALKPKRVFYEGGPTTVEERLQMHIRVFNQEPCHLSYTHTDCRELPLNAFGAAASANRTEGASSYLKYGDLRDRGYVMSIKPAMTQTRGEREFHTTKDQGRNHPLSSGVFDELLAYHARMPAIVADITQA